MKHTALVTGFFMAFCLCGPADGAFAPVRQAQPRLQKQTQPKKKMARRASVKRADTRALQAEADMKHHENDVRLRQFQQMQQAQQRAYRQRIQSQQGAQSADR